MLSVPLTIHHDAKKTLEIEVKAEVPAGWKVSSGAGKLLLPGEADTILLLEIDTPKLSDSELRDAKPQAVKIKVEGEGFQNQEIVLNVLLRSRALPQ